MFHCVEGSKRGMTEDKYIGVFQAASFDVGAESRPECYQDWLPSLPIITRKYMNRVQWLYPSQGQWIKVEMALSSKVPYPHSMA
jgi:hypothetical protein